MSSYTDMRSLRASQRDLTTDRILQGAETVLRAGQSLTFASVALAAELPERTVYRHFETRELLVQAAWRRVLSRFANDAVPHSVPEYLSQTAEAFQRFSGDPSLVRAVLHSREVVELREIDDSARRAALERCVASACPKLPRRDCRKAAAVLRVLHSAPAWELLTDLWGFDALEASQAVELAVRSMLTGLGGMPVSNKEKTK